MKRIFSYDAHDRKSMTLGELRAIINETAALDGDGPEVKVRVTFGGGIKSITITDEVVPPPTITVEPPAPGTSPWN